MVGNVFTFQNQQRHMACHSKWKGKQLTNNHLLLRTLTAAHSHPVGCFHPNEKEWFPNLYPND